MKIINVIGLAATLCLTCTTIKAEDFDQDLRWRGRLGIGGTIPEDADLTEFAGPVSGEHLQLAPGFQLDLGATYRVTPWLEVGPGLGFLFNTVDSFGESSYRDTSLFQMPIMAEAILEYPYAGRLAPYIGGGVGGVASVLTFGSNGYWEPDGTGSDFVLGFEALAGLRYRFNNHFSLGVVYRFLATEEQNWNVDWWTDSYFRVGIDSMYVHSFSLVLGGSF